MSLAILEAFRKGVKKELAEHRRLGNPIATWKDGKVVIETPKKRVRKG